MGPSVTTTGHTASEALPRDFGGLRRGLRLQNHPDVLATRCFCKTFRLLLDARLSTSWAGWVVPPVSAGGSPILALLEGLPKAAEDRPGWCLHPPVAPQELPGLGEPCPWAYDCAPFLNVLPLLWEAQSSGARPAPELPDWPWALGWPPQLRRRA